MTKPNISERVKSALAYFDKQRGFLDYYLSPDHPAIAELRAYVKNTPPDKFDSFAIASCYLKHVKREYNVNPNNDHTHVFIRALGFDVALSRENHQLLTALVSLHLQENLSQTTFDTISLHASPHDAARIIADLHACGFPHLIEGLLQKENGSIISGTLYGIKVWDILHEEIALFIMNIPHVDRLTSLSQFISSLHLLGILEYPKHPRHKLTPTDISLINAFLAFNTDAKKTSHLLSVITILHIAKILSADLLMKIITHSEVLLSDTMMDLFWKKCPPEYIDENNIRKAGKRSMMDNGYEQLSFFVSEFLNQVKRKNLRKERQDQRESLESKAAFNGLRIFVSQGTSKLDLPQDGPKANIVSLGKQG